LSDTATILLVRRSMTIPAGKTQVTVPVDLDDNELPMAIRVLAWCNGGGFTARRDDFVDR